MSKSWAERHPIITGALVGSIIPEVGTLAGALAGVIYDVTESALDNDPPKENDPNEMHQAINPIPPKEKEKK